MLDNVQGGMSAALKGEYRPKLKRYEHRTGDGKEKGRQGESGLDRKWERRINRLSCKSDSLNMSHFVWKAIGKLQRELYVHGFL